MIMGYIGILEKKMETTTSQQGIGLLTYWWLVGNKGICDLGII